MTRSPVVVGILRDHPTAGGDRFARAVRLGFADVRAAGRLAHEVTLVEESADGLPRGSAASVEDAFRRLAARDVVAIIGPAITDNGLVVRDLADAARLPCLNWTGGEQTRSEWMFQYQVGSLEDEPPFLALELTERGRRRIALVADDSIVGRRYDECFADAASRCGIDVMAHARLPADGVDDARGVVAAFRTADPDAVLYLGLWSAARAFAVALAASGWKPPVFANSALMYGHACPEWRAAWDGWCYVDAYADRNPVLHDARARLGGDEAGAPVTVGAAYDMGRLVAEGIGCVAAPTRATVHDGLERVKLVPAALGAAGTTMGFGRWKRSALEGRFLVLRTWRGGASVEIARRRSRASPSRSS
jgi:ABC-type branched-subunit amino acid transport system substrate-binding protein